MVLSVNCQTVYYVYVPRLEAYTNTLVYTVCNLSLTGLSILSGMDRTEDRYAKMNFVSGEWTEVSAETVEVKMSRLRKIAGYLDDVGVVC